MFSKLVTVLQLCLLSITRLIVKPFLVFQSNSFDAWCSKCLFVLYEGFVRAPIKPFQSDLSYIFTLSLSALFLFSTFSKNVFFLLFQKTQSLVWCIYPFWGFQTICLKLSKDLRGHCWFNCSSPHWGEVLEKMVSVKNNDCCSDQVCSVQIRNQLS